MEKISENVFDKSKHQFGTYEEAKAYREAVVADLRTNRNLIIKNQVAIIMVFVICMCLWSLTARI